MVNLLQLMDGAFDGDGRFCYSYNKQGINIIKMYSLTWHEIQTGVKISYAGLSALLPILGNNKKNLNYSENIVMLAIQAAVQLQNFIMNTENLTYAAYESPEMQFDNYF
jgi:hypothetical protein